MIVPGEKAAWSARPKGVIEVQEQYQEGAITRGEQYNKVIEIWSKSRNVFPKKCSRPWKRTIVPAATSIDLHHGGLGPASKQQIASFPDARLDGSSSGESSSPITATSVKG